MITFRDPGDSRYARTTLGWFPGQAGFQHALQMGAHLVGPIVQVGPGRAFLHIGDLAQFQLDCMNMIPGNAIIARNVSAFEPAIQHGRKPCGGLCLCQHGLGQIWGATLVHIGAQIKIWQSTVKETGNLGCNRMCIPQYRMTMIAFDPV